MSEDHYRLVERVSEGSYGSIYRAFDNKNREVMIKRNKVNKSQGSCINNIREVDIMRNHCYPFIISLEQYSFQPPYDISNHILSPIKDKADDKLYLVMEKGNFDARTWLNKGNIPELDRKLFMMQLLLTLEYIHSRGVVHRDVKPENCIIFTDDSGNFQCTKLTDFGMAVHEQKYGLCTDQFITIHYRAPEVALFKPTDGKVDCWSAGCIMFELYSHKNDKFIHHDSEAKLICTCVEKIPFDYYDYLLGKAIYGKDINKKYELFQNSSNKITKHLKSQPSNDVLEVMCGLLDSNPFYRWTATDALNHSYFDDLRSTINSYRCQYFINKIGKCLSYTDHQFVYQSSNLRKDLMNCFITVYNNRKNKPCRYWYSHNVIIQAMQMCDIFLVKMDIHRTNEDINIWISTFLMISTKLYLNKLMDYGVEMFRTSTGKDYQEKVYAFEELLIKDVFSDFNIINPLNMWLDHGMHPTERNIYRIIHSIANEEYPSGTSWRSIILHLQKDQGE